MNQQDANAVSDRREALAVERMSLRLLASIVTELRAHNKILARIADSLNKPEQPFQFYQGRRKTY